MSETRKFTSQLVGDSPRLREVLSLVEQVAPTQSTVLLRGETGTGKELVARAIHINSTRKGEPFVGVSCAALTSGVLESELFGHELGAFTGAVRRRIGRFELADRGTLFLDEVGDLPMEVQIKLLRVLQEKKFERVGGAETVCVNVRLVSATNRDLEALVAKNEFRQDLYYRLNVFPIYLPPLRERLEDVPKLIEHFLDKCCQLNEKVMPGMDSKALAPLEGHRWPGNVRELENVVERALILAGWSEITADHINLDRSLLHVPAQTLCTPSAPPAAPALAALSCPAVCHPLEQQTNRIKEAIDAIENWAELTADRRLELLREDLSKIEGGWNGLGPDEKDTLVHVADTLRVTLKKAAEKLGVTVKTFTGWAKKWEDSRSAQPTEPGSRGEYAPELEKCIEEMQKTAMVAIEKMKAQDLPMPHRAEVKMEYEQNGANRFTKVSLTMVAIVGSLGGGIFLAVYWPKVKDEPKFVEMANVPKFEGKREGKSIGTNDGIWRCPSPDHLKYILDEADEPLRLKSPSYERGRYTQFTASLGNAHASVLIYELPAQTCSPTVKLKPTSGSNAEFQELKVALNDALHKRLPTWFLTKIGHAEDVCPRGDFLDALRKKRRSL